MISTASEKFCLRVLLFGLNGDYKIGLRSALQATFYHSGGCEKVTQADYCKISNKRRPKKRAAALIAVTPGLLPDR